MAAFRATLEEIREADVLVHVVDLTHPNAEEQAMTVRKVLEDLGVADKPTVVALNKIDALGGVVPDDLRAALELPEDDVPTSAHTGQGLDELLIRIDTLLSQQMAEVTVCIPYASSALVDHFHRHGRIADTEYGADGVLMHGLIPQRDLPRVEAFRVASATPALTGHE